MTYVATGGSVFVKSTRNPHVTRLLHLSGDIELNPGPGKDIVEAMGTLKSEVIDETRKFRKESREELREIKTTQNKLTDTCSRLGEEVESLKESKQTEMWC